MTHHQAIESCPFCGSTDISDGEVLTTAPAGWSATQSMCRGCGALGPEAKLPEGECDFGDVRAIIAWNRRAPAPAREPVDRDALTEMESRKDAAYYERNQVAAALAKCFPSGKARTAIEGWSEDWHGCVYIDLPTGQVSWHYHDSHEHLFYSVPHYLGAWDGHDTPEKYRRLAALRTPAAQEVPAVPPDMVLVPRKLTEEMHVAAVRAIIRSTGNDDCPPNAWAAMLAASPSVDQAKRLVGGEVAGPQWTSVEYALPDVETDVLVFGKRGDSICYSVAGIFNGECYAQPGAVRQGDWMDQDSERELRFVVTHWMPLPEAPDRASTGSATSTDTKEPG